MVPRIFFFLLMALGAAYATAAPRNLPPLVPEPTGDYLPGKVVWADVITTEPNAAARFYRALFDWTSRTLTDESGKYIVLSNADGPVVGVARGPNRKDERPRARWLVYFSTANIDDAAGQVTAQGGRVLAGPGLLPDRGWHALVADPEGALFGLMHSTHGDPLDREIGEGGMLWTNLFARDVATMVPFYENVTGTVGEPWRGSSYVLADDGVKRASISPLPEETSASATWVPFFKVGNIARKAKVARRLGAKTALELHTLEGGIQVVVLVDPLGGVFALLQEAPKTEVAE
jgi:predicted enzyme related to lactoylglutathione lyase